VREAVAGEDEQKPGHFMVQTAQPSESAEDPMGIQRPTDRDDATAAEDLAESVADLPEARLVTRPGSPKEVLLSSEPPRSRAKTQTTVQAGGIAYPEWDYRIGGYRTPGAIVRTPEALLGDPGWAAATLERHAALVSTVRRRFELLRARRVRLRRQLDGEEIDLEACVESAADFRAGLPRAERLYQTLRPARREMALALLIDVSGSTDSWVSGNRRIIDVEREALLLVCIALETMRERYTVQAFSGEGPGAVTVRSVKGFDEHHGEQVSRRIAALEPERYTRVGAALRHVTAMLMREPARHRLLLLLSDGKPNDVDHYEGRYGVEDMRQAVLEARLQGIAPFCLTVDRSAAAYLPGVFGATQYALLPRPELLPTALLDWIRRLASA
jgi:nitric oxide reductase NorD protein